MVRQSHTLQSVSSDISGTHLAPYSYYNIIGYISYAILYIPVTIFINGKVYLTPSSLLHLALNPSHPMTTHSPSVAISYTVFQGAGGVDGVYFS